MQVKCQMPWALCHQVNANEQVEKVDTILKPNHSETWSGNPVFTFFALLCCWIPACVGITVRSILGSKQ
jgi:hypothetical protein